MQSTLLSWLGPVVPKSVQTPLRLKRRIRIHDSDDEDVLPVECQERGPLHQHLPPNHPAFAHRTETPCHPAADSAVHAMPPELLSNSDVSDDEEDDDGHLGEILQSDADAVDLLGPVSDTTAARDADVAATIGTAPGIDPQSSSPPPLPAFEANVDATITDDEAVDLAAPGIDPLNLWKSVPRAACQYLDLSAQHHSDNGDDDSLCNSESSSLTEGFIDSEDSMAVHPTEAEWMAERLPVTLNAMRRVRRLKYPARLPSSSSLQSTAASQAPLASSMPAEAPLASTMPADTPCAPRQVTFADFIAKLWAAGEWELDDVHTALDMAGGSYNYWSNRPSRRDALFASTLQHLQDAKSTKGSSSSSSSSVIE